MTRPDGEEHPGFAADGIDVAVRDRRHDLLARLEENLLLSCTPVGDGLRVWAVDEGDHLELRGVIVEADRRGGWAFARWFLGLPKDRMVVATQVTNERLAQVFVRGGFRRVRRYYEELETWEWIYVRKPTGLSDAE